MIRWIVVLVAVCSLGASLPNPPSGLAASAPTGFQVLPWSGILAPARATDWSQAGVVGGIPARPTACATLGLAGQASTYVQSVTATQISNAVAGCTAGQHVKLNAGTYNIGGMTLSGSNVTLRGSGANTTILNVDGVAPSGCHIGEGQQIGLCTGSGNMIGSDPPVDNSATWNCDAYGGVCPQGLAVLTLSARTNLTVGSTIWLDQLYEASDGYPTAGNLWMENWGSGDSFTRSGRGLMEGHVITACGTSTPGATCTSNTITITPGLVMPHWRSDRSPGAYWGNTSTVLNYAGIEDLTIDFTASGGNGLYFINCTNCWLKGTRILYRAQKTNQGRLFNIINGMHISVVDNYFYGYFSSSPVSIYTLSIYTASQTLVQNNIVHAAMNPFTQNSASFGNIYGYNYVDTGGSADALQSSLILHGVAGHVLVEGNAFRNFSGDNIHSAHMFGTLFRNHFSGQAHNGSGTETQSAVTLYAAQRFFNLIGNVAGNSQWNTYSTDATSTTCAQGNNQVSIFFTGWLGSNSTGCAATGRDTNVARTLMRWGNWDHVTSGGDNGTNDQTGTRWVSGEVPSGITYYANPVPASHALPASFYLSAQPAWWATAYGTPPWPAVGPDVTGADNTGLSVNNGTTEPTGGHVYKIPSRLCFENIGLDANYASSNPRIKAFNRATCYPGS